jgi:hypothetical protein
MSRINGFLRARLTGVDASVQGLTHTAHDFPCNIYPRHLISVSSWTRKLLNMKHLGRYRILFHHFEEESKQNGHLGLLIPASAQTYPQFLWKTATA